MSSPTLFSARLGGLILLLALCSVRCQGQVQPEVQPKAQTYACIKTSPAPAGTPIQWTIHVKVALDSDKKIKYEACPFPTPADPMPNNFCPEYFESNRDLHLCTNDTVVWQVHTKNGTHGSAVLLQPDGLLGQPAFVAQESNPSPPATVGQASMPRYEYYVGAVDQDDQGRWYTDDPKMIVGGSNVEVLTQITELLSRLRVLADSLQKSELSKKLEKDIQHAQDLLRRPKSEVRE